MARPTFHLVPAAAWSSRAADAPYAAASLADEGFAHCTDGEAAMLATANRHYRSDPRTFLLLTLDLDRVGSPWRFDDPGRIYPHVYGPIDPASVERVTRPVRLPDGSFVALETPAAAPVCDALVRRAIPVRHAPLGVRRLEAGEPLAGPALPATHAGSVDVFLEAIDAAPRTGGILVIDDAGRTDEACIGDLVVGEAKGAGIAAIVVWGAHRDSAELARIGLPVWSLGAVPVGPRLAREASADRLRRARLGEFVVTDEDVVIADDDGVVVVAATEAEAVLADALAIQRTERRQADALGEGRSLRDQLRFREYLERRATEPTLDFRKFLAEIGGAVETLMLENRKDRRRATRLPAPPSSSIPPFDRRATGLVS